MITLASLTEMHACIIPPSNFASTRTLSTGNHNGARSLSPTSFHPVSCLQKAFQQDSAIDFTWASAASSTKRTGPSSPSPSPTVTNDFLDDDTNAPTSLPPVVRHLTRVVRQAKEKKYKPYNRKRPRTMELRFAEKYIGPSGMDPVDARRGRVLVERGLKHLSCEAIAQAVLTKEADLEWKRLCALASAWEIEACRRHERLVRIIHDDKARTYASAASESLLTSLETLVNSNLDSGELQTRMAFAISAYSEDRSLYSAAYTQLDNLEYLAHEHYSEAVEDHLPTSPTDADASASSLDEDDSAIVHGIAEISTKSD